ncbi:hypothetical protein IWW51_004149, partial [Coemansia sp. RSA 2702]
PSPYRSRQTQWWQAAWVRSATMSFKMRLPMQLRRYVSRSAARSATCTWTSFDKDSYTRSRSRRCGKSAAKPGHCAWRLTSFVAKTSSSGGTCPFLSSPAKMLAASTGAMR